MQPVTTQKHMGSGGPWLATIALANLLAGAALPSPALAQADAGSLGLKELKILADQNVQSKSFSQSIPYLEELILRLQYTEEERTWKVLEWAMFQLGVAHLEMGRYATSVTNFHDYIKRWPKGNSVKHAYLLQGEAYASQEQWHEVRRVMRILTKNPSLRRREQVWARRLIGESYFREQKWAESIPSLTYVVENCTRRELRDLAAVQVTTALVKVENFDGLFRFIPYVYRTTARFDIDLNIALIQAGDRNYETDRYPYAISSYRLVHFKSELEKNLEVRIATAEHRLKMLWNERDIEFSQMSGMHRNLKRLIKDYKIQRVELRELPDYDQEVIIRMAQTYLNLERYWEALTQFRRVFDMYPDHELAEQGLYSAYATAREMEQEERAMKEGYDYLQAFPLGTYWEGLTVSLGQLHVRRKEYTQCLRLSEASLEEKPDHSLKPNLLYLMGYCHFHLNQHEQALDRFAEILSEHPDSAFVEDASYWHPMAHLFLHHYTPAREEFGVFLATFPESTYYEDGSFRYAVGFYGEGNHPSSEEQLQTFVKAYPKSRLLGEAYCMLGDITASWAKLDLALDYYRRVPDAAVNMTEINYAAFQSARVYELEAKYDEIIALFRDYIEAHGEEGNFSQALYWIGNAYMRSERHDQALDTFFNGIIAYGDARAQYGIDMMIRDLAIQHQTLQGLDSHQRFMRKLYRALAEARKDSRRTLNLRLVTLFTEVTPSGTARDKLVAILMNPKNLEFAGPLTLAIMGREATARGKKELARSTYRTLLNEFGDSDFTVDALSGLAELDIVAGNYQKAEAHLSALIAKYPRLPAAAKSQKRLGDVFRLQGKPEHAIEAYNTLLSIREWRGPLFPEALYWIGICHLEKDRSDQAFAHFERIYLLYRAYGNWTAKAYWRGAECLLKLNQTSDAVTTLRELIADKSLQDFPETEAARKKLATLGDQA